MGGSALAATFGLASGPIGWFAIAGGFVLGVAGGLGAEYGIQKLTGYGDKY